MPTQPTSVSLFLALLEPIQPCAVHRNLIVHLIRLVPDTCQVYILRICLIAYRPAQLIHPLRRTMQRIY
jgi:hypothetical protein